MKTRVELIEEFIDGLHCDNVDISYCASSYGYENINSFDDLKEAISDNNGFDVDIIYYANAIEYLKENDPSLRESLEIADELGYEVKNLNSELLASLLATRQAEEDFNELQSEVDDFFEDLPTDDELFKQYMIDEKFDEDDIDSFINEECLDNQTMEENRDMFISWIREREEEQE